MSLLSGLAESFVNGLATPLTAVCALPLYPGFLAYLANRDDRSLPPAALGVLVLAGVVTFVGLVGVVFSFLLQASLTGVVEVVSPVAFAVLAVVAIALLLDLEVFHRVPTVEPPTTRYPALTAFAYGAAFGPIVLPCNPGLVALFFARAPVLFDSHLESVLGFLAFGLGIGTPLLVLALVSEAAGRRATRFLARNASAINRATGAVVLAVSAYYLVIVFDVFGIATLFENDGARPSVRYLFPAVLLWHSSRARAEERSERPE